MNMHPMHESPTVGWLWPAGWQDDPQELTPLQMACSLAELDAGSPEEWDRLFNALLDLPDEDLVKTYLARL